MSRLARFRSSTLRRCSRCVDQPEPREGQLLKHLRFAEIEDIPSARIRFRGVLDAQFDKVPPGDRWGSPSPSPMGVRLKARAY